MNKQIAFRLLADVMVASATNIDILKSWVSQSIAMRLALIIAWSLTNTSLAQSFYSVDRLSFRPSFLADDGRAILARLLPQGNNINSRVQITDRNGTDLFSYDAGREFPQFGLGAEIVSIDAQSRLHVSLSSRDDDFAEVVIIDPTLDGVQRIENPTIESLIGSTTLNSVEGNMGVGEARFGPVTFRAGQIAFSVILGRAAILDENAQWSLLDDRPVSTLVSTTGSSEANDIAAGIVVGQFNNDAVKWTNAGGGWEYQTLELPQQCDGGFRSFAEQVNQSGEILGYCRTGDETHRVFWDSEGQPHDLFQVDRTQAGGILAGNRANGMLDERGSVFALLNGEPFSWHADHGTTELLIDGFEFDSFEGINSRGQLLVSTPSGAEFAVLTPTEPFAPGDLNVNGRIDSVDLGRLLNRFGETEGVNYASGDINGDGTVDSADLGLLLDNFGLMAEPATATVPEPDSHSVVWLMVLLFARTHFRRKRSLSDKSI